MGPTSTPVTFDQPNSDIFIVGQDRKKYSDPQDAEFLAGQFAIALGAPESMEVNTQIVQNGDEDLLREQVARQRNAENTGIQRKQFSQALSDGDAEQAYALMTTQYKEPPTVATERSVAEQGMAMQVASEPIRPNEPISPEDAEKSERMLIISNFLLGVQAGMEEYIDKASGVDVGQAFDELGAAFNAFLAPKHMTLGDAVTLGGPQAVATDVMELGSKLARAADAFTPKFYTDLLASFINTPTAAGKATIGDGTGSTFLTPGEGVEDFKEKLMTLPTEELVPFLEQNKAFLLEAYATNPLRAFTVAWDAVYGSNIINPTESQEQFKLWAKIPEIYSPVFNSDGSEIRNPDGTIQYQVVPNPLYELYAQGGEEASAKLLAAMDAVFSKTGVQNVVDSPILDALAIAGVPAGLAKGISRLRSMTRIAGASTTAASALVQAYKGGRTTADVFRHVHTVLSPVSYADPNLASEMRRIQDTVYARLTEVPIGQRATPDAAAVQAARDSLINTQSLIPDNYLYSVHEVDEGNSFLGVRYGSGHGAGFSSEAAAKAWADSKGLQNYLIESPTGTDFLVNVRHSLEDMPNYSSALEGVGWFDSIRTMMGLGKYILTPNATTTERAAQGATTAHLRVGQYADVYNELYKELGSLSRKEGQALTAILRKGQAEPSVTDPSLQGRWYNEHLLENRYLTMFQRLPSMKEKKAYYLVKTAFDFNYALENKRLFDTAASAGISAWRSSYDGTNVLGKVENIQDAMKNPRFLASIPGGRYTSSAKDAFNSVGQDGIAIRVYGDLTENGKTVTHIFAKKGEYTDVGLPRTLLNYTEGGSRHYVSPWFVKQKNGERVFTLGNFSSKGEANKYLAKFNRAVTEYKAFLRDKEALRQGKGLNAFTERQLRARYDGVLQTLDSRFTTTFLDQKAADGVFDATAEAHVLYDRQLFPGESIKTMRDSDSNMIQKRGRMYYSHRGETLFEDGGTKFAPLENPLVVLERQQNHAIRMAGFSDFALRDMHAWVAKYRHFLDDKSKQFSNPEAVFKYGEFPSTPRAGINNRQQWLADAERAHISRILQHPDTFSLAMMHGRIKAQAWLAGKVGDSKFNPLKAFESFRTGRILDGNIVDTFKAFAYDMSLGMFNITHLWLQALGSQAAVFMHPVHGVKAIPEALVMWGLTHFPEAAWTKSVINYLDASAAKAGVYARGEFAKTIDLYLKSGMQNIGSSTSDLQTLARVDVARTGAIWNSFKHGYGEIRKAGRIFVYEGERIARLVSFNIARRIADEHIAAGRFKYGSGAHIEFMQGESNKLQLGMMSGMEAAWAKGPTALAMQMLQYPLKATEVFLGLNRQLTTQERVSFVIGSLLTYGSYGVPFGPQAWSSYAESKAEEGEALSEEEFKLGLLGGFDAFFRNVMETDTAFGSRLGYGDFHASFLASNKDIADFLGGVSLQTFRKAAENVPAAFSILQTGWALRANNESSMANASAMAIQELGDVMAGASNFRRAYTLHKYGQLLNARGDVVLENDSTYSALAMALGIPSSEDPLNFLAGAKGAARQEEIKAAAKVLAEKIIEETQALSEYDEQKVHLIANIIGSMRDAYEFTPDEWVQVESTANFHLNDKKSQRFLQQLDMIQGKEKK